MCRSSSVVLTGIVLALVACCGCDAIRSLEASKADATAEKKPIHAGLTRDADDDEPAPVAPPAPPPGPRDWAQILGPSQERLPSPQADLVWRQSLDEALPIAKAEKRPLLVVVRCEESKQFAALDQAVRNPDPQLDPLLRQFVTVRLVNGWDIDMRVLPFASAQDGDCSWWAWMLSDDGRLYGTFGGRDHLGEDTRVSPAAFTAALQRVLRHHHDPRRALWNIDGLPPDLSGDAVTVRTLPASGYDEWRTQFRRLSRDEACLRCHQIQEAMLMARSRTSDFDKSVDLMLWPYPENLGLRLDRDDGLVVVEVVDGSPAAQAGLMAGDVLGSLFDRRLFSQTDFRAGLWHARKEQTSFPVRWLRDAALMEGTIVVDRDWRRSDVSWRTSVTRGPIGPIPGFFPKDVGDGIRKRLRIPEDVMAVEPVMTPDSPAARSGLAPTDVVVGLNGTSPRLDGFPFLVWFRITFSADVPVTADVISSRNGARRQVRLDPLVFRID